MHVGYGFGPHPAGLPELWTVTEVKHQHVGCYMQTGNRNFVWDHFLTVWGYLFFFFFYKPSKYFTKETGSRSSDKICFTLYSSLLVLSDDRLKWRWWKVGFVTSSSLQLTARFELQFIFQMLYRSGTSWTPHGIVVPLHISVLHSYIFLLFIFNN